MPEETRRGGDMTAGFWIRRVAPPEGVMTVPRRLERAAPAPAGNSNKENVAPEGWDPVGLTWRRRSTWKSPLPVWYPRTPLRDITAVINALERRRLRVEAARAEQMNRDSESSVQNATLIRPSSLDQSVSNGSLPFSSTPEPSPTCITSFLSPIEHPLQMSSASSSPQISSISNIVTPKVQQHTLNEEELCSSIDQIEKLVLKNLKKSAKKEPAAKRATKRRTLMSMR